MSAKHSKPPKCWDVIKSKITYRDRWLTLRSDEIRLPDGSTLSPYHTVEGPDWVSIIALTTDGEVLLTEEYRHGARQVIMQFPGGHIDEGEGADVAGARELLEETGYGGGTWHDLGTMFGAASRLSAVVSVFLAVGVSQMNAPKHDHGEEIRLMSMTWREFWNALHTRKIDLRDSCDLATLMRLQLVAAQSADPDIARLLLR